MRRLFSKLLRGFKIPSGSRKTRDLENQECHTISGGDALFFIRTLAYSIENQEHITLRERTPAGKFKFKLRVRGKETRL